MRKTRAVLLLTPLVLSLLIIFLSVPTVSGAEEWEGVGIEWYFDNLTDDDRRKIRQAMDYAIPRQQIIDGLHQGLAVPIATEVGQNMMGYDPSVQPRPYDTEKSLDLMEDVFGKRYTNAYGVEGNETVTTTPYFKMTLVSPTTNVARTQWASLISRSFQNIGIDVELKWWNWNIIMPRIYLDPISPGFNYEHGGVDAWFVGMNANPDPDYSTEYFRSQFSPAGDNAFWIENDDVEDIINRSLTEVDLADRLTALSEFQQWFYDEVPKSIIRQGIDVFAVDEELEGFDSYLTGRGWNFQNLTIGDGSGGYLDTMTYTVPGDFVDFNPLLSNSYYDFVPMANVFGTLTQRRGDYNLSHPVGQVAESWTTSADGLTWEVKVRSGIKWDDGTDLTAEDVIFSYHATMNDDTKSPNQGFFLDRFPNNESDIHLKDGTTDTIVFELGAFYPFVTTQVFGNAIIQKAQWNAIDFADWKTHELNTGSGATYPIGFGPYKMTDFDVSTGVKLEQNTHFDGSVLGHDPSAAGGGIWYSQNADGFDTIFVTVVKEATTAVAGLKAGTYHILDSQTGVQGQFSELNATTTDWADVETALEYGWQELSYNHYDPRWGMNAHDPREMYPEDYAAGTPLELAPVFVALMLFGLVVSLRKRK
jgi:ABC-type transport system substrate-binding protein